MQNPPSQWGLSSHSAHFPGTPSLPLLTPRPPPSSLQSSRPHPPKATGTEDSPGPIGASAHPPQVPISATGSPLCLLGDPEGSQAHPHPMPRPPSQPAAGLHPVLPVLSPNKSALTQGPFPVTGLAPSQQGLCSPLLLDDPTCKPPQEGPLHHDTQIPTYHSLRQAPQEKARTPEPGIASSARLAWARLPVFPPAPHPTPGPAPSHTAPCPFQAFPHTHFSLEPMTGTRRGASHASGPGLGRVLLRSGTSCGVLGKSCPLPEPGFL